MGILDKVKNSNGNGYIWHTTGAGKTLTSFKAAQLVSELDDVDKVITKGAPEHRVIQQAAEIAQSDKVRCLGGNAGIKQAVTGGTNQRKPGKQQ